MEKQKITYAFLLSKQTQKDVIVSLQNANLINVLVYSIQLEIVFKMMKL